MDEPIRIAVIGVGKIARDQHLPAIHADERFRLVATVDPHMRGADAPNFADLAGLRCAGIGVDAVAICTPPQTRGALARDAIAAGWHVMLEKPPAATLAALDELTAQAQAGGVTLFAAWHSREAAMVAPARAWLAEREVARVLVTWREDVRRWHPGQAWLWAPGGLGVFDPGINAFSILTALLQHSVVVQTATLDVPANAHTPIAGQLTMRAGAAAITVDLDFLQTGPQTWDILIETACGRRLELSDGGARLAIDGNARPDAPNREYPALYERFADLIAARAIDADAAPLRLVADALLVAEFRAVPAFIE